MVQTTSECRRSSWITNILNASGMVSGVYLELQFCDQISQGACVCQVNIGSVFGHILNHSCKITSGFNWFADHCTFWVLRLVLPMLVSIISFFIPPAFSLSTHSNKHILIWSWWGVSRSRWTALCHILNHPSVVAFFNILQGTQHTNTTKLRETSTLQQIYDSNTWWEERSQPRHLTKADCEASEHLTFLLASAIFGGRSVIGKACKFQTQTAILNIKNETAELCTLSSSGCRQE